MEIRRLKLFRELSRLGSMRAVADELGYTTSTVSQQLGVLASLGNTPELLSHEGRSTSCAPWRRCARRWSVWTSRGSAIRSRAELLLWKTQHSGGPRRFARKRSCLGDH